jgi:hypothetical protein
VESQLWIPLLDKNSVPTEDKALVGRFPANMSAGRNGAGPDSSKSGGKNVTYGPHYIKVAKNSDVVNVEGTGCQTALTGLAEIIGKYCERRDVVRASCRLLVNISHFSGVTSALEKLGILEKLLECVQIHKDTRDVLESTALMLKGIHRRSPPECLSNKSSLIAGLLILYSKKLKDEEVAKACSDVLVKVFNNRSTLNIDPRNNHRADPRERPLYHSSVSQRALGSSNTNNLSVTNGSTVSVPVPIPSTKPLTIPDYRSSVGKVWEAEAVDITIRALDNLCSDQSNAIAITKAELKEAEKEIEDNQTPLRASFVWSKHTPKTIASLLLLLEIVATSQPELMTNLDNEDARRVLQLLLVIMPAKHSDLSRRIERLIQMIHNTSLQIVNIGRVNSAGALGTNGTGSGRSSPCLFPLLSQNTGAISSSKEAATAALDNGRVIEGKQHTVASYTISRFFRTDENSVPKKLYPLHPQKSYPHNDDNGNASIHHFGANGANGTNAINETNNSKNSKKISASSTGNQAISRLLEVWPCYLEKLCPSPSVSREFITSPSSVERMHLVYESSSAAGRGLMSRYV